MYRVTKKAAAQRTKLANIRRSRDAARMAEPAPDYPAVLPDLRRRIIIEDFDFGHCVHVLELHKTDRIDCYREKPSSSRRQVLNDANAAGGGWTILGRTSVRGWVSLSLAR